MRTRTFRLLSMLLAAIVVLLACSFPMPAGVKNASPTSSTAPEKPSTSVTAEEPSISITSESPLATPEEPLTPTKPAGELLAEKTIGVQGGEISAGDFTLKIPNGSLKENADLKLIQLEGAGLFGGEMLTAMYRVEGLPEELAQPVEISIRVQDAARLDKDAGASMAVGMPAFDPDEEGWGTAYVIYPASIEQDTLLITYPQVKVTGWRGAHLASLAQPADRPGIETQTDEGPVLEFLGISTQKPVMSAHFTLTGPEDKEDAISAAGMALDEVYEKITSLGLSFKNLPDSLPVTVRSGMGKKLIAFSETGVKTAGSPILALNAEMLGTYDRLQLQSAAARALFFVIGVANDPNFREFDNLWWHVAVADWAQTLYSATPELYVPPQFKGHEAQPLRSLRNGGGVSKANAVGFGDGMSALVKYLVGRYDEDILAVIYGKLVGGKKGMPAAQAVVEAAPDSPGIWLPDFYTQYVAGKLYAVPESAIFKAVNGTLEVKKDTPELTSFDDSYFDLSARAYRISFNFADAPKDAKVNLSVESKDGGFQLLLFAQLIEGSGFVAVDPKNQSLYKNIAGLSRQGITLLALVANPRAQFQYQSTISSDAALKITLVGTKQETKKTYACEFHITFYGNFKSTDPRVSTYENMVAMDYGGGCSGKEHHYVHTFDEKDRNNRSTRKGFVEIILNETEDKIIGFQYDVFETDYVVADITTGREDSYTTATTVSANDLGQYTHEDFPKLTVRITDKNKVCVILANLTQRIEFFDTAAGTSTVETYIGSNCTSSEVGIYIEWVAIKK